MADVLLWAFQHGVAIGVVALVLSVPLALAGVAYLWFLQGARIIAAAWVWRRFLHWWRTGRTDAGGAAPLTIPGGAGGHSADGHAVLKGPEQRVSHRGPRAAAGRRDQGAIVE